MRIKAPAIAAVTIGFAIVLVWYFRSAPESTDAPEGVVERARAPSETVVAAPEPAHAAANVVADMPAPATEPVTAPTDGAPTLTPAPLPGETPVMPMAQLLESAQRQIPPALVQGEREFAAESVDANWAPGAEGSILSKFAEMPGLALISMQVECRSTMCRLQVASPNSPDAASRPFNILVDSIGLETRWKIAIIDPSGALQSVAYMRRESMAPE